MKPCEYGCGAEVTFVLLGEEDGKKRWSLPMDKISRTVVKVRSPTPFQTDGLRVTERFFEHRCAEGDQARLEKRAYDQQQHAMRKDTARRKDDAWVVALQRDCPKCGAGVMESCLNLRNPERHTAWPHAERLPEGYGDPVEAPASDLKG